MRRVVSTLLFLSFTGILVADSQETQTTSSLEPSEVEECALSIKESRYRSAVGLCQKALGSLEKGDPKQNEVLLNLAIAQEQDGSPWLAVSTLQRIIDNVEGEDSHSKAWENLSNLKIKFGEFELAREYTKKITNEDIKKNLFEKIKVAETIFKQAQMESKESKWRMVEKTCQDLISKYTPYSKEAYDMRIDAFSKLKEWQRAVDSARSKSKIETDSSETDFLIGKIYLSMAHGNEAFGRKYINQCAKLNPENKKCLGLRSKLKHFDSILEDAEKRMLLKEATEALEELLKIVDNGAPTDEVYYDKNFPNIFEGFRLPILKVLCAKQVRRKNFNDALSVCQQAMNLDSANKEFYLVKLGELHLGQEKYDDSINFLRQAARISPRNKEIQELLQKAESEKIKKNQTKYYDILGVSQDATEEQINRAYKALRVKHHPDKQIGHEAKIEAEERVKEIHAAYEVLSNPEKRRLYDAGVDPSDPNSAAQGGFYRQGGGGGFDGGVHINFEDLASMFGGGARGGRNRRRGGFKFTHEDL